jgi:hypothetical protein
MFSQSFEGQTRSRPAINLSGAGGAAGAVASGSSASSSSSAFTPGDHNVANRARADRAHREHQRRLDRTARSIQAFYRSKRAAGQARDVARQEYDALAIGGSLDSKQLLHATRILAFILTPVTTHAKSPTSSSRAKCSKADLDRLGRWSRTVAIGKPRVALFQEFEDLAAISEEEVTRWSFILQRIARVMLAQAADNAR